MCSQLPGKVRLALSPPEPQWQHVALYLSARGLTTGPIPLPGRELEILFDLIDHEVRFAASDGQTHSIALRSRPIAEFYRDFMEALHELGVDAAINPKPQEVPDVTPLDEDNKHTAYDPKIATVLFRMLSDVEAVFQKHRAPYAGRHSRLQFFWGGFDLSYSRFSGQPAPPPPGANYIMRTGMDAEEVCSGFWFGDQRFGEPALYAYMFPKRDGYENAPLRPSKAFWNKEYGLYLLSYADVRAADSPETAILEFLKSTYDAAGFSAS